MSNPTVSFRISNSHLARGLRAIRILEPNWQITTPSDLIRTVFNDYIAKSEHFHNSPLDVSQSLLDEIIQSRLSKAKKQPIQTALPALGIQPERCEQPQQILEQKQPGRTQHQVMQDDQAAQIIRNMQVDNSSTEDNVEHLSQDKELDDQIELALNQKPSNQNSFPTIMHKAPEEYADTGSTTKIVNNFSPPEDWKE